MEAESAKEWKRLVRMQEQDRISQASSLATISAFPVHGKGADGKVQTFGKRGRAVKRDPNCAVVIRGWLYKQDSSGLKLWKRRWFVLSDFCLFYYKDSREESVLGSIPLPSYNILFCSPRECKNRKYAFKAVHQGMRSYIFSADTQEDMLGWVRALSQSANMEMESSLYRRCSSYQDFTRIGGSSESLDLPETRCIRSGAAQPGVHGIGSQSESSPLVGGRMATPQMDRRGKQKSMSQSPSPRTSTPTNPSGQRMRGQSFTQETGERDSLPLSHPHQTPPQTLKSTSPSPLTPRAHLGSRPHTPVGRVDIRPQDDPLLSPQSAGSAPPSPRLDFGPTSLTPTTEKRHVHNRHIPAYPSPHPISTARRSAGKPCSPGGQAGLLPPLPPPRIALVPPPSHHHHHHRSHLSLCQLPPAMSTPSELFQGRDQQQMRSPECEVDAVLTRLCGCDKLLQSLAVETAQLQADKENVHCALEMARLQLEEWKGEEFRGQGVRGQEELLLQKAVLQDDLVTIRARMCDVSMEMERVWTQYERMESELSVLRSHLQHICRFGRPQEQSQAQRELWMMEDILCGLKANRHYFRTLLRLPRQTVASPILQKSVFHPGAPSPQADGLQNDDSMRTQSELPPRPPLPLELQGSNQDRALKQGWLERESHSEAPYGGHSPHRRAEQSGELPSILSRDRKKSQSMPDTSPGVTGSIWSTPDITVKRVRMSEEEQRERMKRNQERLANQKQAPTSSATNHSHSPPREEPPFPLRVTRVLTAVLPTTLVARRVSVEDPPEELSTPLPEQISPPEVHQLVPDQNRNPHRKHRELSLEAHQNSARVPKEVMKDKYDQNLALACEEPSFHKADPKSDVSCLAPEVLVQSQPTPAVEDGKKIQKSPTCPASELQDVNETSTTPEKSRTEPEKSPRPRRCDRLVSGNGGVPSDLRLRDEDGCSAFTGNLPANEGREKVRGRSSFQVSGRDGYPELCLTQEQRDAKLKRVERIRARVMRSAVRESSTQPSSLTGNPFDRLMKHSTATNDASGRLTVAGTDDTEECCRVEGADCADRCRGDKDPDPSINVATKLRPSRVPTLKASETEGNKQSKKSNLKKFTQMHLECHAADNNNSCCHNKGAPGKRLISANHVTELVVFPASTNIGSTQGAGNCHPTRGVTKTAEEVTGDQNEASILPTNRRAEWFLSTNHITKCIPTFDDHKNITTDFTIEHSDTSAKTPLSAATGNADRSDKNTQSASPDVFEPIERAEKTSKAIHPSSPKNPSKHNHRSYLIKLASETEESDHFNSDVLEELTLFANEKVVELSTIQNEGAHKLAHYSNEERESSASNGCEGQLTKPVIPCGEVNLASVASSVAGDNIEAIFSGKPQDLQMADPDISPSLSIKRISHSSPQSACELHIYEEIPNAATLRANQNQECPTSVNDLTSNPLVSRHTEHLPLNMSGHDASSSLSSETGGKTGNDLYTHVQADVVATDENPELSERMGEDVHLPEDQSKVDGTVKNGKDQKRTPFAKARVTVVRTSL